MSVYNIDKNFFETIDTQEKAYWLGFIAADGCVYIDKTKHKRHSLCFGLNNKDENHLRKFLEHIKSEHKIRNCGNVSSLQIINKKMCCDLMAIGIVPRKTFCLQFPQIDHTLHRHFIRGYFDGDGCWHVRPNGWVNFSVACFSPIFLMKLQDVLAENAVLNKNKISNNVLHYDGARQCSRIYSYLYKDSTVFLDRKKQKVKNILENYVYVHPTPPKTRVIQILGDDLITYESMREASRLTNIDRKKLSKLCREGVYWKYD